ncbi:GNAT family N-acetyltransferase [Chitinophaga japonensis]|uniref:N-acetylglutamate synthase-like GNAT family acetyltransferase n=1 Tax=Chitinophaga japonensis TaxID=104662 RepID=A0A562SN41_CHIJA|nr:GNAT family N-acetyltransferase [Chitinophaga japonensis]TWI82100.1 N-acetylglutamate synthase-like GNAT family acetyltransferase [Chitinophaga japonensis]
MENQHIIVRVATPDDKHYAKIITDEMESSAKARGTGIAKRTPEYVEMKMEEGKAVIAVTDQGEWVGFCYIEAWGHEKFVANSGLIVNPAFRGHGVAKSIKQRIFELSRKKYPDAKIFGLTTGLAVMKINSELGYEPVTYSELTDDEEFWKGCRSCVNFDILTTKQRTNCLCTAMLYDPEQKRKEAEEKAAREKAATENVPTMQPQMMVAANGTVRQQKRQRLFKENFRLFERWLRYKRYVLLKTRKDGGAASSMKKKFFLFNLF